MGIDNYLSNFYGFIVTVFEDKEKKGTISYKKVISVIVAFLGLVSTMITISGHNPLLGYKESYVMIDDNDHHIGDKNMSSFVKYECEGANYSKTFIITHLGNEMFISISAQNVDPDLNKSPIYIYLNDQFVDYLNKYYKEEVDEFSTVEIKVDSSFFHSGENKITIKSGEEKILYQIDVPYDNDTLIYGKYIPNIDDIGFRDLKIVIRDY